jgi:hypothetical protein
MPPRRHHIPHHVRTCTLPFDSCFLINRLYQRYIYRVDFSRVNEFGQGGDDDDDEPPPAALKSKPAALGSKSQTGALDDAAAAAAALD